MTDSPVFVDSAAWYAMADRRDQHHKAAKRYMARLAQDGTSLLTTNLVLHESAMLLMRKLGKEHAIRFLHTVTQEAAVEVVPLDAELEREGLAIFVDYQDQDFSITDCVSFAAMRRAGMDRAFTFDKHFSTMNFVVVPPMSVR
jgi:predicted nucleic acid-binding protein